MPRKTKASQPPARIRGFTSLEDHKAADQDGKVVIGEIDGFRLRRVWHNGEWWHSVVDVVSALTESADGRKYWNKLSQRLREEGSEVVTSCHRLKLPADDGKMRETDCAPNSVLFRIIESAPFAKAEPIKLFLAEAGAQRLEERADPSRAIDRAIGHYRELGRDEEWIDHRLQNISARNELTDEWANRQVPTTKFGELTNEMSAVAMGIQPAAHAELKGVKPQTLRDHMNKAELAITTVSETAAKEIVVHRDTKDLDDTKEASLAGAYVARAARTALEEQLGRPVASKSNFLPKADGSDTPLFASPKPKKK